MSKLAGLMGAQGWTVAGIAAVAIAGAGAWWGGVFDREGQGAEAVALMPRVEQGETEAPAPEADSAPAAAPEPAPEPEEPAQKAEAAPEPETGAKADAETAAETGEKAGEKTGEKAGEKAGETTAENTGADTAAADAPEAPRLDLVRVEPDGSATVAGRGAPGAEIVIELDGEELGRMQAGNDGSFAGFVTVPPSEKARVMRLVQLAGDVRMVSADEAILAPVKLAAAAPMAEPAPEAQAATQAAPEEAATQEAATQEAATQEAVPEPAGATAEASAPAPAAPQPAAETVAAALEPPAPAAGTAATEERPVAIEPAPAPEAAPAPPQTVVLMQNAEGVRVVQPPVAAEAGPEVMSAVAIDAITYSEAGEVEIAGRGRGDGFVRVYLDNSPITTSRIAPDGNWRTDLPDVDSGVYTLRVDQVDAEGRVVSRVETPFKREAPQVLAEAGPVAAITVQPGDTLWAISRENYGEGLLYVRLFEANRDRIRDPDLIYPGQVFDIPRE